MMQNRPTKSSSATGLAYMLWIMPNILCTGQTAVPAQMMMQKHTTLNKSLTISGYYSSNRPTIKGCITIGSSVKTLVYYKFSMEAPQVIHGGEYCLSSAYCIDTQFLQDHLSR